MAGQQDFAGCFHEPKFNAEDAKARTCKEFLSPPPRRRRGERTEARGVPTNRSSSPRPSPPSDGGEGVFRVVALRLCISALIVIAQFLAKVFSKLSSRSAAAISPCRALRR